MVYLVWWNGLAHFISLHMHSCTHSPMGYDHGVEWFHSGVFGTLKCTYVRICTVVSTWLYAFQFNCSLCNGSKGTEWVHIIIISGEATAEKSTFFWDCYDNERNVLLRNVMVKLSHANGSPSFISVRQQGEKVHIMWMRAWNCYRYHDAKKLN